MSISVSWFLLGVLAGIGLMAITVIRVMTHQDKNFNEEQFVKKLIEKEGWMGAQEVLHWHFNDKHMKTWRRLYREHIEKGENKND